ncbi:MAG TPA: hypothetical protein DIT89_12925 [Planctomycetaceae bacterium]|nr:hypothetical protein [Planctomycetaceae bacterium]
MPMRKTSLSDGSETLGQQNSSGGQQLAPVVLFVYARPTHTRRTLESLAGNTLAAQSELTIFADGPRADASPQKLNEISEVRKLIRERQWCGKVHIRESAVNRGLAASIVAGVTEIVEQQGSVIVLEDDLETSPGFLQYMNNALTLYLDCQQVMQVCGFSFPCGWFPPQTGFLRASHPWGWATWKRAWRHYQPDAERLLALVLQGDPRRFDLDGYSFHLDELQRNADGRLQTWAVRWYASIFLRQGLCLYPGRSLVRNLGFDGTGENCHSAAAVYERIPITDSVKVVPQAPVESPRILKSHQQHYRAELQRWTESRLVDRIRRRVRSALRWLPPGR